MDKEGRDKERDRQGWRQGWSTEKLPQGVRLQITTGLGEDTTASEIILTFEDARHLGEWLLRYSDVDSDVDSDDDSDDES